MKIPRSSVLLRVAQIVSLSLVLSIASISGAQNIQLGGGVGGYMPTGDVADVLSFGPTFHGTLLYTLNPNMRIEGSIGYWWFRFDDEITDEADAYDIDVSGSMIPVTGGLRFQASPQLHLDAGGGFYRIEMEVGAMGISFGASETDIGIYGGAGYTTGPINIAFRTHFPDFDDLYLTLSAEYLFNLQ